VWGGVDQTGEASEAHDCKFEDMDRDQKSLNLVMYNRDQKKEREERIGVGHSRPQRSVLHLL